MICQRMMVRGVKSVPEMWQFTVNTEATTAGAVDGAVPINLRNLQAKLHVDWGDGSSETFSGTDSWDAPMHTYATPGLYQISVKIDKPENIYLMANVAGGYIDSTYGKPYRIMRDTLISIDAPMPSFAGVVDKNKSNPTQSDLQANSFKRLFYEHKKLTTLPSPFFKDASYITTIEGCFYKCSSLAALPENFLQGMENLSSMASAFSDTGISEISSTLLYDCPENVNVASLLYNCTSLFAIPEDILKEQTEITSVYGLLYGIDLDFEINIYSPSVSNMTVFVDQLNSNNRTRVVHVIPGSTTESTFLANASSYHLTIISDIT